MAYTIAIDCHTDSGARVLRSNGLARIEIVPDDRAHAADLLRGRYAAILKRHRAADSFEIQIECLEALRSVRHPLAVPQLSTLAKLRYWRALEGLAPFPTHPLAKQTVAAALVGEDGVDRRVALEVLATWRRTLPADRVSALLSTSPGSGCVPILEYLRSACAWVTRDQARAYSAALKAAPAVAPHRAWLERAVQATLEQLAAVK